MEMEEEKLSAEQEARARRALFQSSALRQMMDSDGYKILLAAINDRTSMLKDRWISSDDDKELLAIKKEAQAYQQLDRLIKLILVQGEQARQILSQQAPSQ